MQIDVSTAIALATAVFVAGGGWITIRKTARSAMLQGIRIGKLEIELAEMRGARGAQRVKTRHAVPVAVDVEENP